jgi:hypothetical protein
LAQTVPVSRLEEPCADPPAVGRQVARCTASLPIRAPAVRAVQALGVEVAFQPARAEISVQAVGHREVDHLVR